MPPYMKNGKRDYKTENEKYKSRPEQKKKRALRNAARRMMGGKSLGDVDVHHKDNNPANNSKSNLQVISRKKNRSFPRNKNGGHL